MEEIKKVLSIDVQGEKTVKDLKKEISDLKDALLNVEKGSDDYRKIVDKLIDNEKELTNVMSIGKREVKAAAGSYNALSQEMSALKKVFKEVTDEAERNRLAVKINEINDKLKDSSDGVVEASVSVGVAFSEKGYSIDAERSADMALNYVKENGRGVCKIS